MRHFPAAALITLLALAAAETVPASPTDARGHTADFIRSLSAGDCGAAAEHIVWPLQHADERIGRGEWNATCATLGKRLRTGRIHQVFGAGELAPHEPEPNAATGEILFVDVITRQAVDGAASGMSLVFECREDDCALRAVHDRLLNYRHYAQATASPVDSQHVQAARLAGALNSLSGVKLMVAEHYMVYGEWPESLAALGHDGEAMHTDTIERVEVGEAGRIRARLSQSFGAGRVLDLVPGMEMNGMAIRWQCRSNLPGELLAYLPGLNCRPLADILAED